LHWKDPFSELAKKFISAVPLAKIRCPVSFSSTVDSRFPCKGGYYKATFEECSSSEEAYTLFLSKVVKPNYKS
jgi:hypothetical protein